MPKTLAKERRSKKVHLTKMSEAFNVSEDHSLYALVATAWRHQLHSGQFSNDWELRSFTYSPDAEYVLSVGRISPDAFFGQVACLDPRGFHRIARLKKGADLKLDQIPAEDDHGPLLGTSYFLIFDNWLLLVDDGIHLSRLSAYLSWMVTKSLPSSSGVHLQLTPKIEVKSSERRKLKAKSLSVRPAPVLVPTPIEAATGISEKIRASRESSQVWDILQLMGVGYEAFSSIDEHFDDGGQLELEMTLKYRKGRKLQPITSLPIDGMISQFPEGRLALIGDNSKVVGEIAQISFDADIDSEGAILDTASVHSCLAQARKFFLKEGFLNLGGVDESS